MFGFMFNKLLLYFFTLSCIPLFGKIHDKNINIDSLESIINKQANDSNNVNSIIKLVSEIKHSNPEKAQDYLIKAIDICNAINFEKGLADCYHLNGMLHSNKGLFEKAIEYYEKSLVIREKHKDKRAWSNTQNNLGLVNWNLGKFDKAIEHYLKSLKIDEEFNDKGGMSISYNNIGLIYWSQGNLDKALEYILKANELNIELNNIEGQAGALSNIGGIYFYKGDVDLSIDYFIKARHIYEKLKDKKHTAQMNTNLGEVYGELKKYTIAIESLYEALNIQQEIEDRSGMIYTLNNIGQIYLKQENYEKAIEYLINASKLAESIGAKKQQSDTYKLLSEVYAQNKNFGKAFEYQQKYIDIKDSILNEVSAKQVAEMETRYETEKKQQQIEIQSLKLTEQELTLQNNRVVGFALASGIILLIFMAVTLYNRFLIKKKANEQLQVAYTIIEEKNKDITDSIEYAKTLQEAILPKTELLQKALPQSFIFFKPKDIISGDFYWFHKAKDKIFIAAADCTGHGVPGALVSMVGTNFLNQIVIEKGVEDPGKILSFLHKGIHSVFRREQSMKTANDGMDISLLCLNLNKSTDANTHKIQWAGANNPLWIYKKNNTPDENFIEIKGDPAAIGGKTDSGFRFGTKELEIYSGDMLYLFSDGYQDQFGGEKGKKFLVKRFRQLCSEICHLSAGEQSKKIEENMSNWKGSYEQVDDMLIIGIKI
jgi:tetratricopeptide (TPR) repeat protein